MNYLAAPHWDLIFWRGESGLSRIMIRVNPPKVVDIFIVRRFPTCKKWYRPEGFLLSGSQKHDPGLEFHANPLLVTL